MNSWKHRITKHHHWGLLTLPLYCLLWSVGVSAADDTKDNVGITPYAGFEIGSNSNLLGLPNAASAQAMGAGSSLSDRWENLLAGVSFDETYGIQEITGNASVAKIDFDRLQILDHYDKEADLDWHWHTAGDISGDLGFTYQKDLTPFIDFHLLDLNMRTQSSEYADIKWLITPSYRLTAGFTNYHLDYDLLSQQPADRNEGRTLFGIDYLASSGSSIGLQYQHIAATFPVAETIGLLTVNNDYSQNEVKLKIDWNASAITQVHFLGGWVNREYDDLPALNFSGPNSRITVDWLPTTRLTLVGALWREIGSVDDLTAAYSLNHGVDAEAKWEISEKFRLEGKYQYIREDFSQSATVETTPYLSGSVRTATILFTYLPTRHFELRTSLGRIIQNQYSPNSGFTGNSIALQGRYNF